MCEEAVTGLHAFWVSCRLPERRWPGALRGFQRHWELIQAHNAAAGLTACPDAGQFHLKHVADSLAVLRVWPALLGGAVADVGSGAGLPGIVLALALPELRVTAIESNHRKADFLALAAGELALTGRVNVLCRRSRQLARDPNYRRRFAVVTARAVAPAGKIIRDARGLLAPGGSAVLYKTPAAVKKELPQARREAARHKLTIETSEVIELPGGAGTRQLLRVVAPP